MTFCSCNQESRRWATGTRNLEQFSCAWGFYWTTLRFVIGAFIVFGFSGDTRASSGILSEFPFQFRDGLIWIEVHVPQSRQPLHFLLDSGAEVSVLNLQTAKRLHLKLGKRVVVEGVESVCDGFWPQRLAANVEGTGLPEEYLAVDLGRLNRACRKEVDGLIGADFFAHHVVRISFATLKIQVLQAASLSENSQVIELEARRGGMLIPVQVDNEPTKWARLDTGCATALEWVTSTIGRKDYSQQTVAVAPADGSAPMVQTTLRLGKTEFTSVPTGLHPHELFAGESGLIGNGVLSRCGALTIDAAAGRLLLEQPVGSLLSENLAERASQIAVLPGQSGHTKSEAPHWWR